MLLRRGRCEKWKRGWPWRVGRDRTRAVGFRLEPEATHELQPRRRLQRPDRAPAACEAPAVPSRAARPHLECKVFLYLEGNCYELYLYQDSGRLPIMHKQKIHSPVFPKEWCNLSSVYLGDRGDRPLYVRGESDLWKTFPVTDLMCVDSSFHYIFFSFFGGGGGGSR